MTQRIVRQPGDRVPRKSKERALQKKGPDESLKDLLLSMPNVGQDRDFARTPQKRHKVGL